MEHSNILNGNDWRAWVRSHGDDSAAPPLRKHLTAAVKGAGISPTTGLMRFDFREHRGG